MTNDQFEMSSVKILDTPDKSENDKKSYRLIELENGLKALLISDSSANAVNFSDETANVKLAAASLLIDVGSFSDPPDTRGMAHFLEHMVFMGSEKYPDETDFSQHLQKFGGFSNAHTTVDNTNFHFQIRENAFGETLDRFAHFFKSPLLSKDAMDRERQSIESEFNLKKHDLIFRQINILGTICQFTNRLNFFIPGNIKTLKDIIEDDILNQKLRDFHKRHYSAHRMYLCLQSTIPLDDLQKMANEYFSDIPNNQQPGDDFSQINYTNMFSSKFYDKVYFIQPTQNITKIDISWCIKPMFQNFKCKPESYLAHIFGYEGEGSLTSYLRKKLWAINLFVNPNGYVSSKLCAMFVITISLTDSGFDHLDDVIEAVFSYAKFIQLSGPKESLFQELKAIQEMCFDFSNEYSALNNVVGLVKNISLYPPKYVLTGASFYFEYDENVIQNYIDQLSSRKFNIMVISKRKYNENIMYDLRDPLFNTKYSVIDMPEKWISSWQNAIPFPEFKLPAPNPFITDDFTIFYEKGHILPKYPTKILGNDLCELWFRQDDKFLLPTACYTFMFLTPLVMDSIENIIQLEILNKLLKYQLIDELYSAICAGFSFGLEALLMGLRFQTNGFNQKLHLIIDSYCKCLKSLMNYVTEKGFEVCLQELIKEYTNVLLNPVSLANDLSNCVMICQKSLTIERLRHIRSITFADFQQFHQKFCAQLKIKALIQGNITEDHAITIMNSVLRQMNCRKVDDLSSIEIRMLKLPIGKNYLRFKNFQSEDVNTCIFNYYHIGAGTYRTIVLNQLLLKVAYEPAYDTLRTKEQLSYSPSFAIFNMHGSVSYVISLNSQEPKFSIDYIDERIENFRCELVKIIESMSNDDFEAIKSALMKTKVSNDNNLMDEVRRNLLYITSGSYDFDSLQKEANELVTVTKTELLEFYKNTTGDGERKLSVQVIGNARNNENEISKDSEIERKPEQDSSRTEEEQFNTLTYMSFKGEPKGTLITDIMEFKITLEKYPGVTLNNYHMNALE